MSTCQQLPLRNCLEENSCGLESVSSDKDTLKQLNKLSNVSWKSDGQKKSRKYIDKLIPKLPDRPPVAALDFVDNDIGQCGFTDDMKQRVRAYRLDSASPETLAREARCEIAYENLQEAKMTRYDTVSMADNVWGFRYQSLKKKGGVLR